MAIRYFALVLGIIYLLLGVLGFLPGLVAPPPATAAPLAIDGSHGYLFGMFPINALHNLVHMATGLWGILAYRTFAAARLYARGVAIIFGVLTVMGLFPVLNTVFGLMPIHGNDVWLHGLTTVAALYFGWMARGAAAEAPEIERRAAA